MRKTSMAILAVAGIAAASVVTVTKAEAKGGRGYGYVIFAYMPAYYEILYYAPRYDAQPRYVGYGAGDYYSPRRGYSGRSYARRYR